MKETKEIFNSTESWKLVNFCKIDKFAVKSYCAVHNVSEELNLGDITNVNEYSFSGFNMICGDMPVLVCEVGEINKVSRII